MQINSSQVNWRETYQERPWLCGFESNQQLAIIEPSKLFVEES
jgi:hypothetical protein